MIPKAQFFDALGLQKIFPGGIMLHLFRQAVMKAIQFNREFCDWTIKIEVEVAERMLAAELEAGESSSSQRQPELLFLAGRITTQQPGDGFPSRPSPWPSPRSFLTGRGNRARNTALR